MRQGAAALFAMGAGTAEVARMRAGLRQRGLFAMGAGTARMRAGLRQRGLFAMGADRGPAAAGAVRDGGWYRRGGQDAGRAAAAGAVRDGG